MKSGCACEFIDDNGKRRSGRVLRERTHKITGNKSLEIATSDGGLVLRPHGAVSVVDAPEFKPDQKIPKRERFKTHPTLFDLSKYGGRA